VLACAPACSLLFDARDVVDDLDGEAIVGPIARFEATPLSLQVGDTALLVWETSANETSVQEEGDEIANDASGVRLVEPKRTTTYRIVAGGEAQELTLFVDEDVPPEILSFRVAPNVLAQPPDTIDASWRVSHGDVSLLSGTELEEGLPIDGSFETTLDATTELTLFALAAGAATQRIHAWSVDPFGSDDPRAIDGTAAIALAPTAVSQRLSWNVPELRSLSFTVVDDEGDCVDATIELEDAPGGVPLDTIDSCEGDAFTVGAGLYFFEVSLIERPALPIFVPEWRKVACGNGIVEPGEACDDHDLFSGDGCDASCASEAGVHVAPASPASSELIAPPSGATPLVFRAYGDGDDGWALVPSPFAIRFYGRTYRGLIVHRHGAITFELDTTERAPRLPTGFPDPSFDQDLIAPLVGAELDEYEATVWSDASTLVVDLSNADARVQVLLFAEGGLELRFGGVSSRFAEIASGLQERTGSLGSNSFTCFDVCELGEVPADSSVRFR
jgi:cysteine-rich repeat protein